MGLAENQAENQNDASGMLQDARKALLEGQTDQSIELVKEVLKHYPREYRALYLLVQAFTRKGAYQRALATAKEGLDFLPGDETLLRLLSEIYKKQHNFHAATEVLERLYEKHPHDGRLLKSLASFQPHLKLVNRAKKLSRRAAQQHQVKLSGPEHNPRFNLISLKRLGENTFYYQPKSEGIMIKKRI